MFRTFRAVSSSSVLALCKTSLFFIPVEMDQTDTHIYLSPSLSFSGKQHNGEFSRLIAQVRGRLENSRRTKLKQEEEKSVETSCCSGKDCVCAVKDRLSISKTSEL